MSLSVSSSSAPVVNDIAPQKAPTPKPPAEPVANTPPADTVSLTPAAQKLHLGDVDHDGDSH